MATELDWTTTLDEQLSWHWDNHARPRLESLTDDEYFWEPVGNCWNVLPRSAARTSLAYGASDLVLEFEHPEPAPPPVTTIAWRLAHVTVSVFGVRNSSHFGGHAITYETAEYPATASDALDDLDAAYDTWITGVRGLDAEGLARPVGAAEGPFAAYPYAALICHINREVIHHLAEIMLLRDLYRSRA
ncbi:MAG TPA: DinB family protein [Acidimicrobiales bacterium]|jgi:hypothetical protein